MERPVEMYPQPGRRGREGGGEGDKGREKEGGRRLVVALQYPRLVSEPDPRKIEKEGLVNRLGWKCTLRPVCRRTSDWLLINILMCVY